MLIRDMANQWADKGLSEDDIKKAAADAGLLKERANARPHINNDDVDRLEELLQEMVDRKESDRMLVRDIADEWSGKGLTTEDIEKSALEKGVVIRRKVGGPAYIRAHEYAKLKDVLAKKAELQKSSLLIDNLVRHRSRTDNGKKDDGNMEERRGDKKGAESDLTRKTQPEHTEDDKNSNTNDASFMNTKNKKSRKDGAKPSTGSRHAIGDDLLSWQQAKEEIQAKADGQEGGIGIVGFQAVGKTWMLRALAWHTRRKAVWSLTKLDEKWSETTENDLVKTSEAVCEELHGRLTLNNEDGMDICTLETSGESWLMAFKPDDYIKAHAPITLQPAIESVRKFVCSCEGFLFLIDSAMTLGIDLREANYGQTSGEHPDEAASKFRDEIEKFWEGFIRVVRDLDSPDGKPIRRPVAVVLTKADFAIYQNRIGYTQIERDYFGLGDLCRKIKIQDYKKLRNESRENRIAKAKKFLETHYHGVYHDVCDENGAVPESGFFAISCNGISESGDRDVRPACVEEPVDWLADKVWNRRKIEKNTEIAHKQNKAREAEKIRTQKRRKKIKRRILMFVLLILLSVVASASALWWDGNQVLENLSDAEQTGNIQAYKRALRSSVSHLAFQIDIWPFETLQTRHERFMRQGVRFFHQQSNRFLTGEDKNIDKAWDYLLFAVNTRDNLKEDMRNQGFQETAFSIGAYQVRNAVLHLTQEDRQAAWLKANRSVEDAKENFRGLGEPMQEFLKNLANAWFKACRELSNQKPERGLYFLQEIPDGLKLHLDNEEYDRILKDLLMINFRHNLYQHDFEGAMNTVDEMERYFPAAHWQEDVLSHLTGTIDEVGSDANFDKARILIQHAKNFTSCPKMHENLNILKIDVLKGQMLRHLENGEVAYAVNEFESLEDLEGETAGEHGLYAFVLDMLQSMVFIPVDDGGMNPFYIDKYETSQTEFLKYAEKSDSLSERRLEELRDLWNEHSSGDNPPALGINWREAAACARFYGKRLPTLDEWNTAFGPYEFPWGDQWRSDYCNVHEEGIGQALCREHRLIQRDRTKSGVMGMSGNVSEWTSSYDEEGNRLAAGGNFLFDQELARSDAVISRGSRERIHFIGMRSVFDIEQLREVWHKKAEIPVFVSHEE